MANLRTNNLSGEGGRSAISGSVFFDGDANTFLKCTDSDAWDFGADNFTIEYWFLESDRNRSERRVLYLYDSNQAFIVGHTNDNGGQIFFSAHDSSNNLISGSLVLTSSNSLSDNDMNTWNHVAITREGSNLKIYLNGILEVTDTGYSTTAIRSDQKDLFIGYDPVTSGREFKGYLSNLRICKGHAVYTSNFTPPYEQLEKHFIANDDLTTLLCCQDSDNPLQEATGKTIVASGSLVEGDDVELVTNSGFTVDISGWTASGVQWSHSSGALMHYGSGNTQRNIYQDVTTVAGRRYVARVLASSAEASTAYWQVGPSDSMTTVGYIDDNNNGGQLEYIYYFTATSTTTRIRFYSYDSGNSGNVRSYWYLASIKLAAKPVVPKVIPPYGVDAGNIFGGAISMNSSSWMYFPTGRTEERGRGRGVLFGGYNPSSGPAGVDEIYYLSIQSMGNAVRFSDLSTNSYSGSTTCASSTRALKAGGATGPGSANPNKTNNIEYVTIATTGNASDFGDMLAAISFNPGGGNQTRGIWMGGEAPGAPGSSAVDTIQYVTIATTGDATDFGDLRAGSSASATGASPTRMLAMGGGNPSSFFAYIDYVEIATTGNAQDFGDMSTNRNQNTGVSSNTRAIAMGGNTPSGLVNSMEFVTIATLGDATDFGDLSSGTEHTGSVNNSTRGVQVGGRFPAYVNTMEFITIATTGNSSDFGDIPKDSLAYIAGASDSHGGLS